MLSLYAEMSYDGILEMQLSKSERAYASHGLLMSSLLLMGYILFWQLPIKSIIECISQTEN